MRVEFLPASIMNELHSSGRTVRIYGFPNKEIPRGFSGREKSLLRKLESWLLNEYEPSQIYVSYNTWADLALRIYVDVTVLSPELVQRLIDFVKEKAPDHYLSCGIHELSLSEGGVFGSFGFNNTRFLVDEAMRNLWVERVGEYRDWSDWEFELWPLKNG